MSKRKGADGGALLICMRIADQPVAGVSTAWPEACVDCSAPVWVSPASYRAAKQTAEPRFVCTHCVGEDWRQRKRLPSIEAPTPEQIAELPWEMQPLFREFARQMTERKKQN